MTALDVIPLEDAKSALVIDYPDRDVEITRAIKSAVSIIEKYTNVFLYERDVEYSIVNGCSNEIYDYPITLNDSSLKTKHNVLSITVFGKVGDMFTASVGYSDVTDIPQNLIDACYKLITYLTENKDAYNVSMPLDVQLMVNQYRRCIV